MSETDRPPIYQPFVPHVEFLINGTNILTSSDGKPKRLMSFSHTISHFGTGSFHLELFDPDYHEIEDLLLTLAAPPSAPESTATGGETTPPSDPGAISSFGAETPAETPAPAAPSTDPISYVLFRYGYVGPGGKKVLSGGENLYYSGMISQYHVTLRVNGAYVSIDGFSVDYSSLNFLTKIRDETNFYNKTPYEIIQRVCEIQGWKISGLEVLEQGQDLPPDKRPETQVDTGTAIEHTEAIPTALIIREHESAYLYIQRVLSYCRSKNTKYGEYYCYLLTTSAPGAANPDVTLYIGPADYYAEPVRRYVYMHRRYSDVISYSPNIAGFPGSVIGSAQILAKAEDPLHGDPKVLVKDETNRAVEFFTGWRDGAIANAGEGVQEPCYIQNPDAPLEGTVMGGSVLAPAKQPNPDAALLEIAWSKEKPVAVDREALSYWLAANVLINQATIQVVGDPSVQLLPGRKVDMFVFVPTGTRAFRLHRSSSRWTILSIIHEISGGSYTTTMGVGAAGFSELMVSSAAASVSLDDVAASLQDSVQQAVGEEGMSRLSG